MEFRRTIETLRWQVFIPQFCAPVWKRFIDRAYIAGVINKVDYGVTWTPQKFEMVDPLKDAQADMLMLRTGTLTLREAINNQGYDFEQQMSEIERVNAILDEKKITLDCDPRRVTQTGLNQPVPKGDTSDAPTEKSPFAPAKED